MIFTERDEKIIHDLSLVPVMTDNHIRLLHFPGTSPAPFVTRMKFLVDAGKVHKFTLPFSTGGRPEYGYAGKAIRPDHAVLQHMIGIADVYVTVNLALHQYPYTLDEWTRPSKRNAVGLIPDTLFVIATDKRPYRFMLEVDKGTESLISQREQNDLKGKFEKYEAYIEQGSPSLYEQQYGDRKGRVLFVCHSLKRLLNIKALCEKMKITHPNRYWFCVMDELKTHGPFSSIWYHAGSDELLPLI